MIYGGDLGHMETLNLQRAGDERSAEQVLLWLPD